MSISLSPQKRALRSATAIAAVLMGCAVAPALSGGATQLGAVAPPGATSTTCIECSLVQTTDGDLPSYTAAGQSVVTEFGLREGSVFGSNNNFTLQIWRPQGGDAYQLVSESSPLVMLGVADFVSNSYVRVSMRHGDVIGLRANTPGGNTATSVASSAGNSVGGILGDPSVGDVTTAAVSGSLRLNMYAIVEPDADGDGYGDETQDICPTDSSIGNTACSGTRVGIDLTDRPTGGQGCGGSGCLVATTGLTSGNAVSPIDGVIVRWRFKTSGGAANYRLRVVKRQAGDNILAVGSSPALASPGIDGRLVHSGGVRVPISSGDLIGLDAPGGSSVYFKTLAGMSGLQFDSPVPDGSTASPVVIWNSSAPLVSADVEPDADRDGFGDITQDQCPTQSQTQGACLPLITNVKVSRAKFRVNTKGGKKSRTRKGTTLSFDSAASGTMTIAVQQVVRGRTSGSKCVRETKRNRRKKSCNRYVKVHEIKSSVAAAGNSLAYTGRYKRSGKIRSLKPGKYRFVIVTQNSGGSDTATSRVVRVVTR